MTDVPNQPDPNTTQTPGPPPADGASNAPVSTGEAPTTYDVKVNGVVSQVTLEELKSGFSHNTAADAKMRQAADAKKAAEEDTRVAHLAERMFKNDDPTAMRDLAIQFGKSPEEVDAVMDLLRQPPGTAPASGATASASGTAEEPQYAPIGLNDLDPELQREILGLREAKVQQTNQHLASERDRIFADTEKRIDEDPILGTITDVQTKQMLVKHAQDLVQLEVGLRGQSWPGVLETVVQEIRAMHGSSSNRGPAGTGVSDSSGIGPTAAMASGPSNAKPIDSVPMTDIEYKTNFMGRLQQRMAKIQRQRQATG